MKKIFLLSVIALITTFVKTNAQGDVTITAASTLCNNVDVVIYVKQSCGTEFKTNRISVSPNSGPTIHDISSTATYWIGGTIPTGPWTIEQVIVHNICGDGISTGSSCGYSTYYNNAILYTGNCVPSVYTPTECFETDSPGCFSCTTGSDVFIDMDISPWPNISLHIY